MKNIFAPLIIDNENSITGKEIFSMNIFIVVLLLIFSCSKREIQLTTSPQDKKRFVSLEYNHFEGGVLFLDVNTGIDVLWEASFNGNNVFKENLAYFLADGLLILPNYRNTPVSASMTTLRNYVENGKMFVVFQNHPKEVMGIIHTHPNPFSVPMPSPKNDYQFCYLGIHHYIMDNRYIFDAYKDHQGNEVFDILGSRNDYAKIAFTNKREPTASSFVVKNH